MICHRRFIHHVGGVQPPAQPGFQDADIGGFAGEGQQRSRGGDLEKGDGFVAVGDFGFLEQGDQVSIVQQSSGNSHPLGKADRWGEV